MIDVQEFRKKVMPYTFANKRYNKVFGIGYNKTGTTSLETIFAMLGFKVPLQTEQEVRIVRQLHLGNLRPLQEFVSAHDAFQDHPFAQGQTYVQVDALFPDSKFILTIRDPEAWFDSLTRFHRKIYKVESLADLNREFFEGNTRYLYKNYSFELARQRSTVVRDGVLVEDWSLLYDRDYRIAEYNARNHQIMRYFAQRPDDLLVIDLTVEKDTRRILEFLGIPEEFNFPIPHENRTG